MARPKRDNTLEGTGIGHNLDEYSHIRYADNGSVGIIYNEDAQYLKDTAIRLSKLRRGTVVALSEKEIRAIRNGDLIVLPLHD